VALMRVYCGLAATDPDRAPGPVGGWLTAAVVDDAGRLLDVFEIGDDPAGYAELGALLAERSGGSGSVAVAADHDEHEVTLLLAAAGRPLAIADEEMVSDYADRFADDDSPEEIEAGPAERNAVGLARALQAGALAAGSQGAPRDLVTFKPVLAAHAAMAAGRQGAAVALREVLRELYPAALRAYPDPAAPIPLAILDALPEPGLLGSGTANRGRDAAVTADLTTTGVADPATIADAITALRVAIAETPRRTGIGIGIGKAATAAVAETIREAVAAVRACDAAIDALIGLLAERSTGIKKTHAVTPLRAVGSPKAPVAAVSEAGEAITRAEAARAGRSRRAGATPVTAVPAAAESTPTRRGGVRPTPSRPSSRPGATPATKPELPAASAEQAPMSTPMPVPPPPGITPIFPNPGPTWHTPVGGVPTVTPSWQHPSGAYLGYAYPPAAALPPGPSVPFPPAGMPPMPQTPMPQTGMPQSGTPQSGMPYAGRPTAGLPQIPVADQPDVPQPAPSHAGPADVRPSAASHAAPAPYLESLAPHVEPAASSAPPAVDEYASGSYPTIGYLAEPQLPSEFNLDDLNLVAGYDTPGRHAPAYPSGHETVNYRDFGARDRDLAERDYAESDRYPMSPDTPAPGSRETWPLNPPDPDDRAHPADAIPGQRDGRVAPPWQVDDLAVPDEPIDLHTEPPALRLVGRDPLPERGYADSGYARDADAGYGHSADTGYEHSRDSGYNRGPDNGYAWTDGRVQAPVEDEPDDDLLIFAEARSAWFIEQPDEQEEPHWSDAAADQGWQAAERAAHPTTGDQTEVGLPRRVPRANLVPGAPLPPMDERPLRIMRDPAAMAAHTTGYFRGSRRGEEVRGYAVGGRPGRESGGGWDFSRDGWETGAQSEYRSAARQ
jgi:hypothetical protein